MKNIWSLTKKDLMVLTKDRTAVVWMFVLPVIFILLFAFLGARALQGALSGGENDSRAPLPVVNLDEDGTLSAQFLKSLEQTGSYRVLLLTREQADQQLNKIKIGRYLVVPENFSSDLSTGKPVTVTIITHPSDNPQAYQSFLQVVSGAASDTSLELQILDGIRRMADMQAGNPEASMAFDPEKVLNQARTQFERSRQQPLVAVVQRYPDTGVVKVQEEVDLSQSFVPGMTVLFVFLSAATVAQAIHEERRGGSLRRLIAAPLMKWELLLGKMLPIFILTLLQILVMFLIGAVVLPLLNLGRLGIGNDPIAWAITSILMALCATSLGIFIASIARTESQISGMSNAILWIAGFLGGALMPIFIIQRFPFLNFLSRLVPQTWANMAYYDILARGKTLADIVPYLGILLLFTLVFAIIGIRKFRYE